MKASKWIILRVVYLWRQVLCLGGLEIDYSWRSVQSLSIEKCPYSLFFALLTLTIGKFSTMIFKASDLGNWTAYLEASDLSNRTVYLEGFYASCIQKNCVSWELLRIVHTEVTISRSPSVYSASRLVAASMISQHVYRISSVYGISRPNINTTSVNIAYYYTTDCQHFLPLYNML